MNYSIMIRNLKFLAIIVATAIGATTAALAQGSNVLRVKIVGLRNNNGVVRCALFNDSDPAAFPENESKVIRPDHPGSISNGTSELDWTGKPPGKYALACFHDENNNGKFDKNMLGIPKEGFCFSNNVRPGLSAPKFDQCAFDYKGGDQAISITMIYF